jgi:hypothetical protein
MELMEAVKNKEVTDMITQETNKHSLEYSEWFGKPVVLLVRVRQCPVPTPCRIVDESVDDLRILIQPGWEMDVRKELILAVEADAAALGMAH